MKVWISATERYPEYDLTDVVGLGFEAEVPQELVKKFWEVQAAYGQLSNDIEQYFEKAEQADCLERQKRFTEDQES